MCCGRMSRVTDGMSEVLCVKSELKLTLFGRRTLMKMQKKKWDQHNEMTHSCYRKCQVGG